ncbi:zf-HC2 domain-containing protein [Microbulbifer yueqingensis]|uniref:Putative zinc-finger n=1 Tax=Microbulbifer yueqingensis TaxID=658219 RepID=A0A1G8V0V6_9GAMM|nr:zf-HC2 domain-containing protein [Microbulbifer yueqingensis]SDJ59609.1 Putative zinc-finger [Microbulbifer yueqingensis]
MKSCREVTRLLSEAQERPLDFSERASLRFHLMMCGACRNFSSHMASLRKISRAYAAGKRDAVETPPDRSRDD